MNRVIFYFDGFNFYNGLRDKSATAAAWKNYYWLDLFKFAQQFFPLHSHEITAVKYFTAPPQNKDKRSRQSALFGANQIINGNKVIFYQGHYTAKVVQCFAACKKEFSVPEEKCTDVSLALNILSDCMDGIVDTVVLVTADSDQVPTIKMVKAKFPNITIRAYFPPGRTSADILRQTGPVVFLDNHEDKFKISMMPTIVETEKKKYTKPPKWA